MKKRIISLAISVLMLLSLIPLQALAETIILPFPDDDNSSTIIKPWYPNADSGYGYNSKISGEAIFSAMMEQTKSGKAPDSFNDDTLTPYGTQKNEVFTILEKAEIFEYVANGAVPKARTFHDNLQEGRYSVTSGNTADMTEPFYGDYLRGLRFARGVAPPVPDAGITWQSWDSVTMASKKITKIKTALLPLSICTLSTPRRKKQ